MMVLLPPVRAWLQHFKARLNSHRFLTRTTGFLLILFGILFVNTPTGDTAAGVRTAQKVIYKIKPVGWSEFVDMETVTLNGRPLRFFIFRTRVLGFKDTERIYCDPETLFPVRVERDLKWIRSERIIEEYDQEQKTMTLTTFRGQKQVSRRVIQAEGPIDNAIVLPLRLMRLGRFTPGWEQVVWLPKKFTIRFASEGALRLPFGTYKVYHFKSEPSGFQVWVNANDPKIPLKLKGQGDYSCTFLARKFIHAGQESRGNLRK